MLQIGLESVVVKMAFGNTPPRVSKADEQAWQSKTMSELGFGMVSISNWKSGGMALLLGPGRFVNVRNAPAPSIPVVLSTLSFRFPGERQSGNNHLISDSQDQLLPLAFLLPPSVDTPYTGNSLHGHT